MEFVAPEERIDSVIVTLPRVGLPPLVRALNPGAPGGAHADYGCEVSRGVSPGTVDLVATGGGGFDLGGKRRETFHCGEGGFLGPDATPSVIARAVGSDAVERVCAGYNAAIVFLAAGAAIARPAIFGKGEGSPPGVIHLVASSLTDALRGKRDRLERSQGDARYDWEMSISACAYRAESFSDLLAAAGGAAGKFEDLGVETDVSEGPVVSGAVVAEGSDPGDIAAVMRAIASSRLSLPDGNGDDSRPQSGGSGVMGAVGNIATLTTLCVTQRLTRGGAGGNGGNGSDGETQVLRSWLKFVELPDAGALAVPPGRLSVVDGPLAHRGSLAFASMVNSLSSDEKEKGYRYGAGKYGDSQFTRLLRDAFGGNCVTRLAVFATTEDHARTRAALETAEKCGSIANHAVLNDGPTLGLLASLRAEGQVLRDALSQMRGGEDGSADGGGDIAELRLRVAELTRHVADLESQKQRISNEATRAASELSKSLDALEKCARERSVLQGDLVRSEEARLRVARALIDMDEENARLHARISDQDTNDAAVIAEAERDDAIERAERAEMALERAMVAKSELTRQIEAAREDAIRAAADAGARAGGGEDDQVQLEMLRLVRRQEMLESDLAESRAECAALRRRAESAERSAGERGDKTKYNDSNSSNNNNNGDGGDTKARDSAEGHTGRRNPGGDAALRRALGDARAEIEQLRRRVAEQGADRVAASPGDRVAGRTEHAGFKERYAAEVRERMRWKARAAELEATNRMLNEELAASGSGPPPPPGVRATLSAGRDRPPFNPTPVQGWGSPRDGRGF